MPARSRAKDSPAAHRWSDEEPVSNGKVIHGLVHDLVAKQQALSALIDRCLSEGSLSVQDLARLMALHSQNASRLGRLLRDKRALSGEAADGIAGAISQALDELSNEWGIEL